jgi:hypothetical protein
MARRIPQKNRRFEDKIILVDRRKGKFVMYTQIALSIVLIFCLLWLLK